MNRRKEPPKPRMGRPPLPHGQVKSVFTVRLSAAERAAIEAAAEGAGMPISRWARGVLIEAAKTSG